MNEIQELKEGIKNLYLSNKKILEKLEQVHNSKNKWLDVTEACAWLKCSTRTLQKYRDEGMIPFSQIGAKIYFREEDLQEFLNRHYINR